MKFKRSFWGLLVFCFLNCTCIFIRKISRTSSENIFYFDMAIVRARISQHVTEECWKTCKTTEPCSLIFYVLR